MRNLVFIHADDLGLCPEINDRIFDCAAAGALNSFSVICNTPGVEDAFAKYAFGFSNCRLCLHINLVEGKPLSPANQVSLLVNERGEFRFSFVSYFLFYYTCSKVKKRLFREQIGAEISEQINRFESSLKKYELPIKIYIDSHTHTHVIPFIFKQLLKAGSEKILHIRNPYEPIPISQIATREFFSINLLKNIVLKILSGKMTKELKRHNLSFNNRFIGILQTGLMKISFIQSCLEQATGKKVVEVLFHPGGVKKIDQVYWTSKKQFKKYHASKNRSEEALLLKSKSFKNLIQYYYADISCNR